MNTKLMTNLVQYFYGYDGVWDEYKASVVNELGNHAFIVLFWYVLVSTGVTMVIALQNSAAFWGLMGLNLVVIQLVLGRVVYTIKRAGILDETVTVANYAHARKAALRRWGVSTLQFTVNIFLLETVAVVTFNQQSVVSILMNQHYFGEVLLARLCFGLMTLIFRLVTLKPVR